MGWSRTTHSTGMRMMKVEMVMTESFREPPHASIDSAILIMPLHSIGTRQPSSKQAVDYYPWAMLHGLFLFGFRLPTNQAYPSSSTPCLAMAPNSTLEEASAQRSE